MATARAVGRFADTMSHGKAKHESRAGKSCAGDPTGTVFPGELTGTAPRAADNYTDGAAGRGPGTLPGLYG